jgi:hypothetical protein
MGLGRRANQVWCFTALTKDSAYFYQGITWIGLWIAGQGSYKVFRGHAGYRYWELDVFRFTSLTLVLPKSIGIQQRISTYLTGLRFSWIANCCFVVWWLWWGYRQFVLSDSAACQCLNSFCLLTLQYSCWSPVWILLLSLPGVLVKIN